MGDNIKIYFQEMEWEGMDVIAVAEDKDRWRALLNAVMNFWGSIKCWDFLD
jgi:hypothetical protein